MDFHFINLILFSRQFKTAELVKKLELEKNLFLQCKAALFVHFHKD